MEKFIMKPDCYKCKHRKTIPGDRHSSCHHPALGIDTEHPIFLFLAVLGKRGSNFSIGTHKLGIKINQHGFDHGWANFPFNFDPIWIEKCGSFESTES